MVTSCVLLNLLWLSLVFVRKLCHGLRQQSANRTIEWDLLSLKKCWYHMAFYCLIIFWISGLQFTFWCQWLYMHLTDSVPVCKTHKGFFKWNRFGPTSGWGLYHEVPIGPLVLIFSQDNAITLFYCSLRFKKKNKSSIIFQSYGPLEDIVIFSMHLK